MVGERGGVEEVPTLTTGEYRESMAETISSQEETSLRGLPLSEVGR